MFSSLGPLFKATFRQAEQLDTRMGIRKDDPRDENEKRDPREDGPEGDSLWEDSMGVSIAALRAFLVDFVDGKTGSPPSGAAPRSPSGAPLPAPPAGPEHRPAQDTKHARAVQAYQSMADKTAGSVYQAPPPPPAAAAPAGDVDLVQSEDVRAIHGLIADLKLLEEAGHAELVLEKSKSFLGALQAAVARLKSRI